MTPKQKSICQTFDRLDHQFPDKSTEYLLMRTADEEQTDYGDVVAALELQSRTSQPVP